MPRHKALKHRIIFAVVHTLAAVCAFALTAATCAPFREQLALWAIPVLLLAYIAICSAVADRILTHLTPSAEPRPPIPHATSVPPG